MGAFNATFAVSAGHGKGSQTPGKVDPGMDSKSVSTEAGVVFGFSRNIARDLAALAIPTLFRDSGKYFLADDDAARVDAERLYEFHLNSGGGTGTEVFVDTNASEHEVKVGRAMSSNLSNALGVTNRGLKKRDFAILKNHPGMEAWLVEMFFGDKSTDVAKYNKRQRAAEVAVLNTMLASIGRAPVTALPRLTTRGKLRLASRKYLKVV